MKELIVIDDTGSPGNTSESKMLKSDRYSLTAVLIHSSRRTILEIKIRDLISEIRKDHPAVAELHFTDILNHRNAFSNLSSDEVRGIFQKMVEILESEEFFIFHQTMTPRTLHENGLESYVKYMDPSRKSLDYLTLDFLCTKIKLIIEPFKIENLVEVVIDEGIAKKGDKIHLPFLKEQMQSYPYADSKSSESYVLLQIADFYAFTINRMQMLMIKDKISGFDKIMLEILQHAFKNKGLSGINGKPIDPNNFSKDNYDNEILKNFEDQGNLASWLKTNSGK